MKLNIQKVIGERLDKMTTKQNKIKLLKEQYNEYKYSCMSVNVKYTDFKGWLRR